MKAAVSDQTRVHLEDDPGRIAPEEWEQLDYRHPSLRLEVLSALAATHPVHPLRIALLEDEHGIAAALVAELIMKPGAANALTSALYGRAAPLVRATPLGARTTLLCGSPVANFCGVALRARDPATREQQLSRLLVGLESHASRAGWDLAFMNIVEDDGELLSALRLRGYASTESAPTAQLSVRWRGFEGYVAVLRKQSRSSADTVRSERERNRRNGVVIRQVPTDSAAAAALDQMSRTHYRHKNGTEPEYPGEFLQQLARRVPGDFLIFEAIRAERRVAMLGMIRGHRAAWVTWFGIELTDRPNDFTYANITYYHVIDLADSLGLERLYYGNGALDAKRRRGCEIMRSHLLYRPRAFWLRVLIRPYLRVHRAWYRRKFS